ncbi:MAG: THUMP domain-containing protein, partial [Candidatus Nanohalobium sp.]
MEKNAAVVRYSEIGTKSNKVRKDMVATLRQRVEDRLDFEEISYEKVSVREGRIVARTEDAEEAAENIKNLPGVETVSPAIETEPDMEAIKKASKQFSYGETFGVRPNTGETDLSSRDIGKEIGAYVEDFSGASVDLDNPDTELGVDVRRDRAYVFTERIQGPGGFPVGSQG